jgi:hypothetical protein
MLVNNFGNNRQSKAGSSSLLCAAVANPVKRLKYGR